MQASRLWTRDPSRSRGKRRRRKGIPPESIKDSKFSSKSDVWSYGVVLWEIFSYGADPFPKWTKPEVSEYVKNGKYLGKPRNCPDSIYKIMELCFKFKPEDRPSFKILYPVMQQEEQSAIEKTGLYNEI
ncbi:Muscle, skeletal receptor tyrosine-protein kinase [Thelohanellus kitauei]|uniref:Muscle, skeletal receptor tyrosine-protein kinase n=1 Tax=Thelohanellus kitauei TaxID=669202 RepID=A0A0C2JPQ2_THEKT|nr:Muscle, skeletal receptor tyrosine-protein kinase [Thelohanellus kitauei]